MENRKTIWYNEGENKRRQVDIVVGCGALQVSGSEDEPGIPFLPLLDAYDPADMTVFLAANSSFRR